MSRRSAPERTLDAECRAVERGSHARLAGDGHTMLVVSESEPGVNRRVNVRAIGETVTFTCSCPYGNGQPKFIPCVHSSIVARRMERAGLLRWSEGRWVPTAKALEHHTSVSADGRFVSCTCGWARDVGASNPGFVERLAAEHKRAAADTDDPFAGLPQ